MLLRTALVLKSHSIHYAILIYYQEISSSQKQKINGFMPSFFEI
ncbi:hypothetical protein LEP1GSC168_0018 [Leptospira santarosai str. HAI134]|nr:hypothetical protein LEP1GSC168_0018 [Leptospira santarosai str. HAI134]